MPSTDFLHCLANDCADGICRVLLHLRCGVGVGIECEACRVVSQSTGEGFHVYAIFEGQGGEKMAKLVEAENEAILVELENGT